MKKFMSVLLALAMVFSLAACGNATNKNETPAETPAAANLEGTMEELVNQIVELNPVEFMGGTMPVDLTDTSEDGLWAIQYFTGLASAEQITDVAVYEPMMGSLPFSMVLVRVAEGASAEEVAGAMKSGIDQRKWICVEADDLMVVGYGDVVMLMMVGSDTGMTAQSFVDAFQNVCAAQVAGAEVTVY